MRPAHRKKTIRVQAALFISIVGFLITVILTYPSPHEGGIVMPPGQGSYENFDNPPGWNPTSGLP